MNHAVHLASILAIVITVLLSSFLLCVLFFVARKRGLHIPILGRKCKHQVDEKVDPYVLKQDAMGGGGIGAEDLERGVGGKITSIIPPSMAEARSVATSETRGGSTENSRVPGPNTMARKDAGGNGNGSNTESSESRYEEESSEGTRLRNAAFIGAGNTEKEGISRPRSSAESGNGVQIGGQYLIYSRHVPLSISHAHRDDRISPRAADVRT
jgi:hypothetical protein